MRRAAGQPGGARADKLLYQARLALDDSLRLKVVRKMVALRCGEEPPQRPCRDVFRKSRLLERIIPGIEDMPSAGEIDPPARFDEQVGPVIPKPESIVFPAHAGMNRLSQLADRAFAIDSRGACSAQIDIGIYDR